MSVVLSRSILHFKSDEKLAAAGLTEKKIFCMLENPGLEHRNSFVG